MGVGVASGVAGVGVAPGIGVSVGGRNLFELPEATTGRHLIYAGPDPYLFPLSVRDNLLYGLKHRPTRERDYAAEALRRREDAVREATRSGNPTFDVAADWIDYEAAGVADAEELEARAPDAARIGSA